jgi:hypothetical protein
MHEGKSFKISLVIVERHVTSRASSLRRLSNARRPVASVTTQHPRRRSRSESRRVADDAADVRRRGGVRDDTSPMTSAPDDLERAPPASTSAPGDYPSGTRECTLGPIGSCAPMTIHWQTKHTTLSIKIAVFLCVCVVSIVLLALVGEVSAALVFGGALFLKASADMVVAIRADAADLYCEIRDDSNASSGPFVTYDAARARPSS